MISCSLQYVILQTVLYAIL